MTVAEVEVGREEDDKDMAGEPLDTRKALNWGEMVITGLAGEDPCAFCSADV